MPLDIDSLRAQFPFLSLPPTPAYLDASATTQTPQCVSEAMQQYNSSCHGNVHRGMHAAAEQATQQYESARKRVGAFLGTDRSDEIVFTKNATESINLLAHSFVSSMMKPGEKVLLSMLEHHSNIVPWQMAEEERGIGLGWIPVDGHGEVQMDVYERLLREGNVRMVSITGLSNVLGVLPPLVQIITLAHAHGAVVLLDAAQLAAHRPIDVRALACDFLVCSGHKLYGPTGIGVLYGKRALLSHLPPFLGGGGMVERVDLTGFIPSDPPARFEAGTPPVAEAVGLGVALDWQGRYPWAQRMDHERSLLQRALDVLTHFPAVTILGPQSIDAIAGCISFTVAGVHPHDLTDVLGQRGVHLRAGHHCAQPLHDFLGVQASARLSVSLYNTREEIDRFGNELAAAIKMLR